MKEAKLTVIIKETPTGLAGSCEITGNDNQTLAWEMAQALGKALPELITLTLNKMNQQKEQQDATTH